MEAELVADNGCTYEDADKAVSAAFNQLMEDGDAEDQGGDHQRRDQASQLVDVADVAELWHGLDMTAYASVTTDSRREDWELQSRGFNDWLIAEFYERYNKPPTNSARDTAMALLSSKARRDGDEYQVYTRVAEEGGKIYLDLTNAGRQVVEIDAIGWRLIVGQLLDESGLHALCPGASAVRHTFWLLPIVTSDQEALISELRAHRFDASRGRSFAVVGEDGAASEAGRIQRLAVYVPVYPAMSDGEVQRLGAVLRNAST